MSLRRSTTYKKTTTKPDGTVIKEEAETREYVPSREPPEPPEPMLPAVRTRSWWRRLRWVRWVVGILSSSGLLLLAVKIYAC